MLLSQYHQLILDIGLIQAFLPKRIDSFLSYISDIQRKGCIPALFSAEDIFPIGISIQTKEQQKFKYRYQQKFYYINSPIFSKQNKRTDTSVYLLLHLNVFAFSCMCACYGILDILWCCRMQCLQCVNLPRTSKLRHAGDKCQFTSVRTH